MSFQVRNYIAGVEDAHARLGKFKFLRTLLDYDQLVPISMPLVPHTIPTLDPDQLIDHHMYALHLFGLAATFTILDSHNLLAVLFLQKEAAFLHGTSHP